MVKHHLHPSHDLHSNLISAVHRCQYLHIPVNASSWGKMIFLHAGFSIDRANHINNEYSGIVFLRDPIQRWLSGMATWLTARLPDYTGLLDIRGNHALLDVLYSTVRFDEHTEQQTYFLTNLDTGKMKFWFVQPNLSHSMNQYFRKSFNIDISRFPIENASTIEGGKLIPRNYFKFELEKNSCYLQRVKDFLYADYKFISGVKFENMDRPKMQYFDY